MADQKPNSIWENINEEEIKLDIDELEQEFCAKKPSTL